MIPYLLGPGQDTEFKHSKRIARFRQCSDVVSLDTAHPQPSHALTVMCNFQTRLLAATVEVQLFHNAHVVHIVQSADTPCGYREDHFALHFTAHDFKTAHKLFNSV